MSERFANEWQPGDPTDVDKPIRGSLPVVPQEGIREAERELCIDDIEDALGNWGGPERKHYTQAMHRAIDAINKRAKGLDLWGKPLDAALSNAAAAPTDELAELRELSDAATPGVWFVNEYRDGREIRVEPDIKIRLFNNKANTDFIVACVNHVRRALSQAK